MKEKKPTKPLNKALRLSGAGLQMGLTIYACNYLGNWLDIKYDQAFWETSFTLFGIFASMYLIIKQVLKITNDD
ncbi:AtpZ/AtpI family protein [uncultured Kordia sp.]|uniref:AtpZ/AtpI family protein n=1 Tax=uncultured Kordia sp. TaxID=507699 RepID=UPI002611E71F|nr:AtpZ/AtpI family protein [uncultured Kordia sp.]